jgi:hypothetical protein
MGIDDNDEAVGAVAVVAVLTSSVVVVALLQLNITEKGPAMSPL